MPRVWEKYRNAETGEWSAEYEAFYEAVSNAGATDFDCGQVASALERGLTPETAAAEFNKDRDDDRFDGRLMSRDHEFVMDHDMSMNG